MRRSGDPMSHGAAEMLEPWWDDVETDPVHLAAAEWLLRLQEPQVSNREVSEWLEWIDGDPRHGAAFDRLGDISSAMRRVEVPSAPEAIRLATDRYDGTLSIGGWRARSARFRAGIAASIAFAALVCGGFLRFSAYENDPVISAQFNTLVGENRSVMLQDGSVVVLGGHTTVEVAFSEHDRGVKLDRGEAYFEVAKNESSFTVRVGDVAVTAVGTAFNVKREESSESSLVTVTEGKVLVGGIEGGRSEQASGAVVLNAGEQVRAGLKSIGPVVKITDLASVTSWRFGRLSFRQQSLRDAVADVNRYLKKPIVLATPEVGDIIVTGSVDTANVGGWIKSLKRAFNLTAVEENDRVTIRADVVSRERK